MYMHVKVVQSCFDIKVVQSCFETVYSLTTVLEYG